jgi:hypothetical protein
MRINAIPSQSSITWKIRGKSMTRSLNYIYVEKNGKDYRQQSLPMFSLPRPHGAIVPSGLEPTHH